MPGCSLMRTLLINSLIIEWTSWIKSPLAPLSQRGVIPPFGKGREGRDFEMDVVITMRLLITLRPRVLKVDRMRA